MTGLAEYTLETLWVNDDFTLYRGRPAGDATSVLVLAPTGRPQAPASLRMVEHEYSLAKELDPEWAVRPLSLTRHDGGLALVLEDGGNPLAGLVGRPFELSRFLTIATSLALALRQVHQRGLIHKQIEPRNVIVDDVGKVRLTGFGIASRLPRERQPPAPPEVIAGTFAYMAPEQTGRMNRSIDVRSDLYSLGVIFYEMLTGALPFTASDPIEWIHCHIARQPTPLSDRVSDVPEPVAAIVLKLLAKNAEDRYQTAAGLEADLRRYLNACELHQNIASFPLGANDVSDRLQIPEKLYGREREIENLAAAFERVVLHGTSELVVIFGYSGVGKSSVVNELHKVLVPPRGLFAAGKFDQYKRDIPYVTLAQAFQSLVRQLLSKDDAELATWRRALMEALGANGQLMIKLIPELALIIGEQPPVPDVPAQEAQNRFQLTFRRFLGVFAGPDHPLALFLDDLQWLDTATLELLEHLATHPEVRHLLLIGAYRDNEVGPSHPLPRILGVIRNAGARMHEIVLAPLKPDNVQQVVVDSLRCDQKIAEPLAQLVHEKTDGNPFFVIQFLTALADEALLRFDHGTRAWTWDLPRIRAKGFTDNVTDLMAAKLGRLADTTQRALGQLACLGNVAEIATITMVQGGSEERVHAELWEAVRAGLVFRMNGAYRFLHDHVQEAAYALIPDGERAAAHLMIGRVLESRTAPEEFEENVFDIANHLNRGIALITTREERERVVEVNLMAGKRAKRSTAYAVSRNYLTQAAALLSPDAWTRRYEQAFDIYLALSECEYLVGNFAAADSLFDLILEKAKSDLDRVKVHSLRIKLYQVAGKYDEGTAVALAALQYFGVTFPETDRDIQAAVEAQFRDIPINLGGRSIGELLDAPVAAEPAMRAVIDLLVDAAPCAYIARPALFPLVALEAVNRSMRHGNTDQSSFAYAIYAIMLVAVVGDIASGFQFSEMALRLNERFNNARLRGTLLHLHGDHINFWRRPIATDLPILEQAFAACLEVGEFVYAGFLAFETVWQVIEKGDVLEDVLGLSAKYAAFARQSHNDAVYETIRLEQRFVASLAGTMTDPLSFDDDGFDEAASFAVIVEATFGCGIVFYHIMKQILAFLYGRYAEALDSAIQAEPVLGAAMAMPIEATHHFYHALTLTALYPTVSAAEQEYFGRVLEAKLKKLKLWADNCPENYHNRYALVSAEVARIDGRDSDAMRLYEAASLSAREHGFVQNEGLANELAARFYAARGFDTIADAYLRNARSCYLQWGANGKVRQLDQNYPRLRQEMPRSDGTIGTPVEHLDLATVVKVSQTISGEINLEKLIDILMKIALEHAGGERGLLILPRGDELWIEAEAVTVHDTVKVNVRQAPVALEELPQMVLRYVIRVRDSLLLDDASGQDPFSADEYIRRNNSRSVLCIPLIKQAKLIGILYLENNKISHVFTPARVAVLELLASQAAISLENARLYAELISENMERRKAEEALRASEASLAEGQRISRTGSWRWNVRTGTVKWSAEYCRIFGFDPDVEQPSYTKCMERIHLDDRRQVERIHADAIREKNIFKHEYRLVMPDGSIRHLQSTGYPDIDESGDIEFVGAVMDITEARKSQEALLDAQTALAHASRVATLGEISATIAHEVNQPLAAIITNAETGLRWLARSEPDVKKVREITKLVVADARRASEIISRIRAMAARRAPEQTLLSLHDVIKESMVFLRHEFQLKGISVSLDLSPARPRVMGDRTQLQQVIVNLAMNAVQAMAQSATTRRTLLIRTEMSGAETVSCIFEDSGLGIGLENVDHLFDSFFTTKDNGMGMGLPISRSIIQAHGGHIHGDNNSTLGGARFSFALPAHGDSAS